MAEDLEIMDIEAAQKYAAKVAAFEQQGVNEYIAAFDLFVNTVQVILAKKVTATSAARADIDRSWKNISQYNGEVNALRSKYTMAAPIIPTA